MQITVTVPDEFARQAAERGLTAEEYAERVLSMGIGSPHAPSADQAPSPADLRTFGQRHGLRLGPGLTIKDLIDEGRR